jgi:outer membrane lipoprotein-sorting protein
MVMLRLLLVFGFATSDLGGLRCFAGDQAATIDSVLAKWEGASQKCRSLDAKVTRLRYAHVFGQGDRAIIARGRFYYEAPNMGCWEISEEGRGKPNDSSRVVWKGDKTLWINEETRTCLTFSVAKLGELAKPPTASATTGDAPSGSFAFFSHICGELSRALHYRREALRDPREALPLVIDIHSAEVREWYSLTLDHSGEETLLKAVPKPSLGHGDYREIDVILNAKTYMTDAIQIVLPDSQQRVVFILDDQKVNQRPSDRDRLLNPDLSGFRVGNADL